MSVMASADLNRVAPEVVPAIVGKPERVTLVELKNGKLVFKQKPLSFEKMSETMQEIVKFREMLEERQETKAAALDAVPDEHRPLIVKFVHESDKGLQALSKHIQHELLPAQDEDDEDAWKEISQLLPLDVVEKTVKSLASRQNFGLESSSAGGRVPAAWQIWRWEVKEEFRSWLPKSAHEKAVARMAERQQAKNDVLAMFQALSETEQHAIVGSKSAGKSAAQKGELIINEYIPPTANATVPERKSHSPSKLTDQGTENEDAHTTSDGEAIHAKRGRPKKDVDPEKAAKEKEREAKRLAKAEREKKEKEAQNKSRNLLANFFSKPKATLSASTSLKSSASKHSQTAGPSSPTKVPDFKKTFLPFSLKKDAEMAPVNWFREQQRKAAKRRNTSHHLEGNVIVIEDDDEPKDEDVEMVDLTQSDSNRDLGQLTAEERLHDVLSSMPKITRPRPHGRSHLGFKSCYPHPVRTIMAQLNEAEIAGDDVLVRRLLNLLRNRKEIPSKVLVFTEDARPGYFGTWTRNSREVGPRTPFARDVVAMDYSYDSGEEWEEESGDADDVVEDDEEDAGTEEVDSDLDDWLVDDDDEVEPGTPIEERDGSPDFFGPDFLPPPPVPKRKREAEPKVVKKRKVVPLVAFTKGPCWEPVIGQCNYEPFNAYRIHLFNDTPCPIDPFTFVSTPVNEKSSAPKQTPASTSDFIVPDLPPHVTAALKSNGHLTVPAPSGTTSPGIKRAAAPLPKPKTIFPDQHVPLLLAKITELETGSLTFILETVHKVLSEFNVKKNAIEAKVREVAEKSKAGKRVWVVKPEVKATYGIA